MLSQWTSSGQRLVFCLSQGSCAPSPRAWPPCHGPSHSPPGVTHSAWFQGIGSTLELAMCSCNAPSTYAYALLGLLAP